MERIYNEVSFTLKPLPLNLVYLENLTRIVNLHNIKELTYSTDKFQNIKTIDEIKQHYFTKMEIHFEINSPRWDYLYIIFAKGSITVFAKNRSGEGEVIANDIKEYLEYELQNFQDEIEPIPMNHKNERIMINNINSNNINSTVNYNNKATNINSLNVHSTLNSNSGISDENKKKSLIAKVLEHPLVSSIIAGIVLLIITQFFTNFNNQDNSIVVKSNSIAGQIATISEYDKKEKLKEESINKFIQDLVKIKNKSEKTVKEKNF